MATAPKKDKKQEDAENRAIRTLKRSNPDSFPEYVALKAAKKALAEAEKAYRDAKKAWSDLGKK